MHSIHNNPNFLRALTYIQSRAVFDALYLTSDEICAHAEKQQKKPSIVRGEILNYYPKAHFQQPSDKEISLDKKMK